MVYLYSGGLPGPLSESLAQKENPVTFSLNMHDVLQLILFLFMH